MAGSKSETLGIFLKIFVSTAIIFSLSLFIFSQVAFGQDAAFAQEVSQTLQESSQKAEGTTKIIKRKFRLFHFLNVRRFEDSAYFFAFHKLNKKIPFAWYKLDLKNTRAKPERLLASFDFSLLFRVSFSTDFKEAIVLSKTGEIFSIDVKTGIKKSLGALIHSSNYPLYSFPTHTPDGKYIILHNQWDNTLLFIDAVKKNIETAAVVKGFWLPASGGGETPKSGSEISVYTFSKDGNQLTFINGQTLDLQTLDLQISPPKS